MKTLPKKKKKTNANNRCYEKLACAIGERLIIVCNEYALLNTVCYMSSDWWMCMVTCQTRMSQYSDFIWWDMVS